jgi:hypothetical protein
MRRRRRLLLFKANAMNEVTARWMLVETAQHRHRLEETVLFIYMVAS